MSAPSTGSPGTRGTRGARIGPFRHRPFLVYWTGGLVSNIGTWLQAVAASVFVYQLTGSAFAVGVLNFASFLPITLFSVYGGALADRHDRRRIVIVTHAISGVIALGLGIVAVAGGAGELAVIVVGFLLNTAYAIAKPSLIALLPALIPRDELADAVSLNTLQFIIGQLAGPVLASIVIATAGPAPAFLLNAFTYLAPIAAMLYLRRQDIGAALTPRGKGGAAGGAPQGVGGYIREHVWIGAMLIAVVCTSAAMEIVRTTAPALAVEQLRADESIAGLIVAAQSTGSALGVLVFVPLRKRGLTRRVALVAMLIQGAGLIGIAGSHLLGLTLLSAGLVGLGFSLCFPSLTGDLQMGVEERMRGRVMSVHQVAHLGNRPVTALIVGSLAAAFGVPAAALAGLLLIPVGNTMMRRGWRLFDRSRAAEPPPGTDVAPA
ncbi:MAG: MFS transporter [Chloroflexota bacterium]